MSNPWSTGLFDCFSDIGSCVCVYFCPSCSYGQIVSILNTGQPGGACGDCGSCCVFCLLGYFGFVVSCGTRTQIRNKYGLREEPCSDCLVHFLCLACALCQDFREVKKQNGLMGAAAAPEVEEMSR
eukprot:CAMPEP_0171461372 /NCGR_PEP_ID=MMETSP0945-20130129/5847_1 /TAXON_ID=109269 /ORGANISM="Vaucheria litorea, Strain CCMP2940" /LENGTH=125 /DNA_ID=CAMNT_0011987707 /DNA_START=41 /DNA_END=418 /DNA_ORIENTATION=-